MTAEDQRFEFASGERAHSGRAPILGDVFSIPGKRRIYIVDDHMILREGLRELINQTEDLAVCGEAASPEEALDQIPRAGADLAIIELYFGGMGGLDLLKKLKERCPGLPMLILSKHDEAIFAQRSLHAGAKGYIMKHQNMRELTVAIHRLLGGGVYLSQAMVDRLILANPRVQNSPGKSLLDRLSNREVEVFESIGRGRGTTDIARAMELSIKTIETYRARIKRKLELEKGSDLLRLAMACFRGAEDPLESEIPLRRRVP
ncbi:MAG TPA: response regulator transcription factor [Planctomycetota bacterium]|nr:response regulator transcription factor [Planctomycetota bacterium]